MTTRKLSFTVIALLTSSLVASGAGLGKTATATAAPAVAVDAKMDDAYKTASVMTLESKLGGSIDNAADLSAKAMAVYGTDALYVYADVTDDTVDDTRSTNPWDDDSVEIYVDGSNNKAEKYDANDTQFVFSVNKKSFASTATRLDGIEVKFANRDGGYTFEAKIPWKNMVVEGAAAGKKLGFEVIINDDDDGTERDAVLSWNSDKSESWQNPTYFGTLELK
jgi:Carbohydrate family 9 binding domain-like